MARNTTSNSPASWSDIRLRDLFYAYRKAKADCASERSCFTALEFAEYERSLPSRLQGLLAELRSGQIGRVLARSLGTPQIAAKKLDITPKNPSKTAAHAFFSDSDREFQRLAENNELVPEFRVVAHCKVELHIVSALWINSVGHCFDAVLSKAARGARLRRYRGTAGQAGEYQLDCIGSFEPYFKPYQEWRSGGLDAIRGELNRNRGVVAVTLDITSYYHCIDPAFMLNPAFLQLAGVELNSWQRDFTHRLISAMVNWDRRGRMMFGDPQSPRPSGVPIGLSIARVIANVLLLPLDRQITSGLKPIYYGRYVDDIFIVIKDPGNLFSIRDFFRYTKKYCSAFVPQKGRATLTHLILDHHPPLKLQEAKQKFFVLRGKAGLDLIAHIESQIQIVSSERRMMPSPNDLGIGAAADALTAAASASEEADTLRRADVLSVRRLGWAILLGKAEILSRDLPPKEWEHHRKAFYRFAQDHILRPDRILDQIDYVPRLLCIAVEGRDWDDALALAQSTLSSIERLRDSTDRVRLNGERNRSGDQVWAAFSATVRSRLAEAVLRSWPWDSQEPISESERSSALWQFLGLTKTDLPKVRFLAEADLASKPYAQNGITFSTALPKRGESALARVYRYHADLSEFMQRCSLAGSLLPYLFPTRPLSASDLARRLPNEAVFSPSPWLWARFVRAVRGIWVEDMSSPPSGEPKLPEAHVLRKSDLLPIRLGITSLKTSDEAWTAAASGTPQLTQGRYAQLKRLVDQVIAAKPKPTHLLLPELSLPVRWFPTVAKLLRQEGINLIAGLEYQLDQSGDVVSEAVLILQDDRLGLRNWIEVRQPKNAPAPGEAQGLAKLRRGWSRAPKTPKPTYTQGEFTFGVLVCSELQNLDYKRRFQGNVDCVMVLSWNKDLETFASLVEGASLDIHAYIALVNNRLYGDSRVREPAKKYYLRDRCRIRGGENDHLVVVTLDTRALREFQACTSTAVHENDLFKPTPEGFVLAASRKPR
ncbi:MAG: RNA-directed DNA polymerase [Bryobacteraceae bacterium]|nr:RNA-directed DNA polymerase [Bryobacteraceae bacterium]